jgi:hypothetical protein
LTAGSVDPVGDGWLRLTAPTFNQSAFAFYNTAFDARNTDITVSFDFTSYNRNGSWGVDAADGITFFLFDGSTPNPSPGAFGGSLGYAQRDGIPGLTGGWLGVGLDDYGNFSAATEGRVGGGMNSPALTPNSIAVRGQGNNSSGYVYLTGANLTALGLPSMDLPGSTTRPNQSSADFRHATIRVSSDNKLSVTMQYGAGANATTKTVIDNYQLPADQMIRPETFKLGFSAATGSGAEIHEIRNLEVRTSVPISPPAIPELSSVNIVGIAGITLFGVHGLVRRLRRTKSESEV